MKFEPPVPQTHKPQSTPISPPISPSSKTKSKPSAWAPIGIFLALSLGGFGYWVWSKSQGTEITKPVEPIQCEHLFQNGQFTNSPFTVVACPETHTDTILAIDSGRLKSLKDPLVSLENGINGIKLTKDPIILQTVHTSNVVVSDHQYVAAILFEATPDITVHSPAIQELLRNWGCQGTLGPDPSSGLAVLYMSPEYAEKLKPFLTNAGVSQRINPNWTIPQTDPTPPGGHHFTDGQNDVPLTFFVNQDRSDIQSGNLVSQ